MSADYETTKCEHAKLSLVCEYGPEDNPHVIMACVECGMLEADVLREKLSAAERDRSAVDNCEKLGCFCAEENEMPDEPYVMPSWEDAAQVDTVTTAGTSVPCIGSWINTRVCERGTKGCEVVHGVETFRRVRAK